MNPVHSLNANRTALSQPSSITKIETIAVMLYFMMLVMLYDCQKKNKTLFFYLYARTNCYI